MKPVHLVVPVLREEDWISGKRGAERSFAKLRFEKGAQCIQLTQLVVSSLVASGTKRQRDDGSGKGTTSNNSVTVLAKVDGAMWTLAHVEFRSMRKALSAGDAVVITLDQRFLMEDVEFVAVAHNAQGGPFPPVGVSIMGICRWNLGI